MSNNAFQLSLRNGQTGESLIAHWLRSRGCHVLPVYETEMGNYKGPRLFAASGQLIAPDALVFKGEKAFWAEVKHKTAFAWHRNSGHWTTGINIKYFEQYLEVGEKTGLEVWLFFLQAGGEAKDSPQSEPGLFCQEIKVLRDCELMRSDKTQMVYWAKESLIKRATYDQVTETVFQTR
jgi:hypothetical protein